VFVPTHHKLFFSKLQEAKRHHRLHLSKQ